MSGAAPRVVILGFTVPPDVAVAIDAASAVPATQTHNFARSLVTAVRSAGATVGLVSTHPVPDYPAFPQLVFRGGSFHDDGCSGRFLSFVNLPVLKHLTRTVSLLLGGLGELRRQRPDHVLIHGVHLPFLAVGAALASRGRAARAAGRSAPRIVAVLTDPPGVDRPTDGPLLTWLRAWDRRLVRAVTDRLDGVVCLTDALGADLAPHRPRLVMEGIVGGAAAAAAARRPDRGPGQGNAPFRVAYAGGLTRDYGVDRLVAAVEAIPGTDVRLDLYGAGELADWLRERSGDRVVHHGKVPHAELLERLLASDLLVNPRPVSSGFVRYSFPSKLLEYMALSVPVLTTPLPTLPADYVEHLRITDDDSVEALAAGIVRAAADRVGSAAQAGRARAFILSTRSAENQGRRMLTFLARLP
ncbi:glycosyltransferase [Blastococcus capsensis]|uniref:glycosyltransferase n=1 Tax=Blastococcus capsensis TaxID=1564163 RepID=UPI002542196B|nr:glycosyltransferase [Blastococcus capsensis]MDK3257129.1 glycosyltransferase [Blastococcus capsensis]